MFSTLEKAKKMNAYRSKKGNQFLPDKIVGMSLLLALITVLPANAQSERNISLQDPLLGTENAARQFYREGEERMEKEIRRLEQQSQHREQKKPLLQIIQIEIEPLNNSLEENNEQTTTREINN